MMDVIVEIYNHMDGGDRTPLRWRMPREMVSDQIKMDKAGREPLEYDITSSSAIPS